MTDENFLFFRNLPPCEFCKFGEKTLPVCNLFCFYSRGILSNNDLYPQYDGTILSVRRRLSVG